MPLGGYNGLQYGTYGWNTYEDFLEKPNRWYDNTYYSGKPNRGNFHWYGPGELPTDFVIQFYNWEDWQSQGQDKEVNGLQNMHRFLILTVRKLKG